MPHVLGFAGGGMNPRYINVGSNSNTQIGKSITILPTGEIQTIGVGNGAVLPDARGLGSVDLQTLRTATTQVAYGQYAAVFGVRNTGGDESFVAGHINTAATRAAAVGFANNAGSYSFVCGSENNLTTCYGSLGMGAKGLGRRSTELIIGNNQPGVVGAAQTAVMCAAGTTSDATPTNILLSLSVPIYVADDSTVAFSILLAARRTDANNESAGYKFEGVIDRNSGAATTALVGTVTKTVLAEDTVAWDANVTADTTNGAIAITVTGEAAKTIRWVATITLSEATG